MTRILLVLSLVVATSCSSPIVTAGGQAVLDCAKASESDIAGAVGALVPLLTGGKPDWSALYAKALSFGKEVGGCAIAQLAQDFLGDTKNPKPTEQRTKMNELLENFRARELGGATIRTKRGDV